MLNSQTKSNNNKKLKVLGLEQKAFEDGNNPGNHLLIKLIKIIFFVSETTINYRQRGEEN